VSETTLLAVTAPQGEGWTVYRLSDGTLMCPQPSPEVVSVTARPARAADVPARLAAEALELTVDDLLNAGGALESQDDFRAEAEKVFHAASRVLEGI